MKNLAPLSLSDEYSYALDQMEHTNDHLFITGRAGTGKSTLLKLFAKTTKKRLAILAPTGIAALNVGGQTIHSFFSFPPRLLLRSDIYRSKNYRMFHYIDAIIIDEISMVRVEMMDNIDWALRINRGVNLPFGGVQMIFFGDLFQLPPVISDKIEKEYLTENYATPYFFSAHVFQDEADFEMIELSQVYRQEERGFVNLLDSIRLNEVDHYELIELNERHNPNPSNEENDDNDIAITLSSRNAIANEINRRKMAEIPNQEYVFLAQVTGDFSPKVFPTELALKLKLGAQVMFLRNDPEKQFVNGTIGVISNISPDEIYVDILDEDGVMQTINVPRIVWEIIKYKVKENNISSEIVGTFEQFPIKLAWAITIHKSQGKTFDNVIIDIGRGAFEYGQTYVALSRCRTLEGINLKRPITARDIFIDESIVDFYNHKKRFG